MKALKFAAKCILATVPAIALIAFTLLCPFCYMDEEYPAWRHAKETSRGDLYDGADFDTVILGDSGAMSSIKPELVGKGCVNLAIGGATSIEMYYLFSEYLKCHDRPEAVVIMFAPFHYWHIDNYEKRTVYFKAIPVGDLPELYENAKLCGASSVRYDGFVSGEISARMGLPGKYLPAITAARFTGRYNDNVRYFEDIVSSRGYGGFGNLKECHDPSYETSYEDMVIDGDAKLIALYLQKLLKLCDDNDIRVRLIQPAVNTETYEGLNEHYYAAYRNYIKQAASVCADIEYEDKLRVYDGKFFADPSHLNEEGADKFTKEVFGP
ncbi:MAG: hypothetical protein J5910_09970 [Lachnospiraceae bacterium]|nr:hypothetical protein [Lachnospiraceae bacterium]